VSAGYPGPGPRDVLADEVADTEESVIAEVSRGRCFEYGFAREPELPPESNLWLAVLQRAVDDAMGIRLLEAGERTREYTIATAQAWFWGGRDGYRAICEAAGVDADELRQSVMREVGEPLPVRTGPRKRVLVPNRWKTLNTLGMTWNA